MPDVVVVGGGPAGLMAADVISAAGVPVRLFERMPSVGRKLLMAGRGGLNLTHSEPLDALLGRYGDAQAHLQPAIEAFPPEALTAFARSIGQETFVGSSGRVFPRAMKSSPFLRAWLAKLQLQGVELNLRHRLVDLGRDLRPTFEGPDGERTTVTASAIVLALGGASWPRLGSDGRWIELMAGLGLAVEPLRPANVGVAHVWSDHFAARFAGAPLKRIAVRAAGRRARGEGIVSGSGLEGGAIYALIPDLRRELDQNGVATIELDLRPDMPFEAIAEKLRRPRGKQSTSTWLRKSLQLAPVDIGLLREIAPTVLGSSADEIARVIKALPLAISGLGGLDRAISSAGGVRFDHIGCDMMVKSVPGLFAAGEMLDWEAPTGGYLLQGCFSTGRAAGRGVLRYLGEIEPDLNQDHDTGADSIGAVGS